MGQGKRRRPDSVTAEDRVLRKKIKVALGHAEEPTLHKDDEATPGNVLYVGHVPHGFYEKEMRAFFEQFGAVVRLRLARSKKTAGSKGYGFVEFESPQVAEIVAQTMDGYLMFGQRLDVNVVSPRSLHPDTFKNAGRTFKKIPWRKLEIAKRSTPRTEAQTKRRAHRLAKSDARRKQHLEKLGIDYSM